MTGSDATAAHFPAAEIAAHLDPVMPDAPQTNHQSAGTFLAADTNEDRRGL